jgi:1-phosphofructokinase family hexose kinase
MLEAEGVSFRHVEVAGETRLCQTLVESGMSATTELVEEMPAITESEWQEMLNLFGALELEDAIVPISGKLPAGAPADAYARIAALVSAKGGRVIIDAPGEPLLRSLNHEPWMVKINGDELMATVAGKHFTDAGRQLIDRGARSVLITHGAESAFYIDESQAMEIFPPVIEAINPVGSGDAVTAGIAVGISKGMKIEDVLIQGMACGAANALSLVSGMFNVEDVQRLSAEVRIEPIT